MIEILLLALGAVTVAAVVTVVILTIMNVIEWFKSRNNIHEYDKNSLAFTIKNNLASGEFKHVTGVFDTKKHHIVQGVYDKISGKIIESRTTEVESLDDSLSMLHHDKPLVIYS